MPSPKTAADEPSTNVSLLRRTQAGGTEGWRTLVKIYGPVVYRWLRGCGLQAADAADLMQETLLAVSTSLPRFDPRSPQSSFRGWLWTIARNKLRDRQRRAADVRIVDGSDAHVLMEDQFARATDADGPPSSALDDVRLARMRALELLRTSFDPRTWKMFWETQVMERDAAEIADEMGVSKWAVYKAKSRVLRRLREELAGLE